jgi:hypothetical protein
MRRASSALGLALLLVAAPAAALTLVPGHVLTSSPAGGGGWFGTRTIVQIDPQTGATSGSLTLGAAPVPFAQLSDVAVLPDGDLLVGVQNLSGIGFVYRVDPETGAAGPLLALNASFGGIDVAVEPGGSILTSGVPSGAGGSILRIDASLSGVTPLVDLGLLGFFPPIAVGAGGALYAVGYDNTAAQSVLLEVDPTSGSTQEIALLDDSPFSIAVGLDGTIYTAAQGRIVAVDPSTGAKEPIVDSPLLFNIIEVGADGRILALGDTSALHAIDPASGATELVASNVGYSPTLAVVPAPEPAAALLWLAAVALASQAGARRWAPRTSNSISHWSHGPV